jgi:hypothetical protein
MCIYAITYGLVRSIIVLLAVTVGVSGDPHH